MENIIFRKSWFRTLRRFKPEQTQQFLMGLYGFLEGNPVEITDDRVLDLWEQVEPLLLRDKDNYGRRVVASRENGKKGGRPKNLQEPTETQQDNLGYEKNLQNLKEKEKEKEKDKEKDKDNEKDIISSGKISSGKEVLGKNENTIFNLVYHSFLKDGCSPEDAKINATDAIKLKTDEELKVLFNIE